MANIKAAQSGNWSSTSTWSGGVVPGSGDVAYSNTFTVTIDTNVTVGSINSTANAGISASAGGKFQITTSGITLTLQNGIQAGDIGTASGFLILSHTTGTSSVVASANGFTGGGTSNYWAINTTSTGTTNITGAVNAGVGSLAYGVNHTGGGTVNITGNVTAGSGSNCIGVNNNSTGTVNVTGDLTGGSNSSASGLIAQGAGVVTVTGNVTAGTSGPGLRNNSTAAMTVTGNVTATSGGNAIVNGSTGGLRIGVSGSVSTLTNTATVQAISGLWMAVAGADIAYVVPNDSGFPGYTGSSVTLSIKGTTTGDGLLMLDDIASVVGAQIAAANSA